MLHETLVPCLLFAAGEIYTTHLLIEDLNLVLAPRNIVSRYLFFVLRSLDRHIGNLRSNSQQIKEVIFFCTTNGCHKSVNCCQIIPGSGTGSQWWQLWRASRDVGIIGGKFVKLVRRLFHALAQNMNSRNLSDGRNRVTASLIPNMLTTQQF